MKKIINLKAGLCLCTLAFLFSSCGNKTTDVSIKAEDLPASGATSFVTNNANVASVAKAIAANIKNDEIVTVMTENIRNGKYYDYSGKLEEAAYSSNYITQLQDYYSEAEGRFMVALTNFQTSGNFDFSFSKQPGKAEDLPKGMALDIPAFDLTVNGTVNNISAPSSGNGKIALKTDVDFDLLDSKVKFTGLNLNIDGNASLNPVSKAVDFNFNLTDKGDMLLKFEGLTLETKDIDFGMSAKGSVKSATDMDLNLDEKLNGSIHLDYNAKDFGAENSMIKAICIKANMNGSANAKIKTAGEKQFCETAGGNLGGNSSTAIVFKAPNGTGGKLIINGQSKFNGNFTVETTTDPAELFNHYFEIIEKLLDEEKMSKEDFDALKIPMEVTLTANFYDDNNKKTFEFANIKNTYDYYTFLYDLIDTMDARNSVDSLLNFYKNLSSKAFNKI